MYTMRYVLGFMLCTTSALFSADASHFSGWQELLITLLKQQSLQPHLSHHAAYLLWGVNKTLHELIEKYRSEAQDKIWQNPTQKSNTLQDVLTFSLPSGIRIHKMSVLLDASTNIAYGIHVPMIADQKPLLYVFAWPSMEVKATKELPSFVHNMSVNNFFGRSVGCFLWWHKNYAHAVCYLPTGYMTDISKKFNGECYAIKYNESFDWPTRRSVIECEVSSHGWEKNSKKIIFRIDTSCTVKDNAEVVIPWKKIEWDTIC